MSFTKKEVLFIPFQSAYVFYSLLLPYTALTRTSRTASDKSDESEYPCLFPDLRGKAFSLSSSSKMLAVSD